MPDIRRPALEQARQTGFQILGAPGLGDEEVDMTLIDRVHHQLQVRLGRQEEFRAFGVIRRFEGGTGRGGREIR